MCAISLARSGLKLTDITLSPDFIEPSKLWADIIITRGGKNRMAIEVLKAKIRQVISEK